MKSKQVEVEITWLKYEDGGKKSLPADQKYSTVARFSKIKDKWPEEAWSIVLHFKESDFQGQILKAKMSLLFEDLGEDILTIGETFELYEGHKKVANGKIV